MFGHRKQAAETSAEITEVAGQLAGLSLFDGFSTGELARVVSLAEEVLAEKGVVLIEQGRVGLECYVILDGQADIYVGEEHVASLGPGTMVGEMALIGHRPRTATVVAGTPLRLIAFDTKAFKTLLEEMPKAHDRVMELLAARLKHPLVSPSDARSDGQVPGSS